MLGTMPKGEVVKLMTRGTITLPTNLRKKLNLQPGELLNAFFWKGLVVIAPFEMLSKTVAKEDISADWIKDTPGEYLKKVRYNPLEALWAKRVREKW